MNSKLRNRAEPLEYAIMGLRGRRDNDAIDVEPFDNVGQVLGRTEHPAAVRRREPVRRARVDETDKVHTVFRVTEKPASHFLPHLPRAIDKRVLHVCEPPAAARARANTTKR